LPNSTSEDTTIHQYFGKNQNIAWICKTAAPKVIPDIHLCTADITVDLLTTGGQRRLFTVWSEARDKSRRTVPDRSDIDILDLWECMGNLSMLAVEGDGENSRYLVHGTNIARDYGEDLTGKRITDIPSDTSNILLEIYRTVWREQRPYLTRMNANNVSFVDIIERFLLPLTHGGDEVARIIVGCYPLSFRKKPDQFLAE
jgi:hypothetical protein